MLIVISGFAVGCALLLGGCGSEALAQRNQAQRDQLSTISAATPDGAGRVGADISSGPSAQSRTVSAAAAQAVPADVAR